MEGCNSVHNPVVLGFKLFKDESGVKVDETYFRQIVGSLMYLTTTRLDLMFIASLISRYMGKPTKFHLQATKRALRYLSGTTNFGIFGDESLIVYADSDYAGDLEDRKSILGYVFMLGSGAVAWSVTLSTTEAEFVAAAFCASQEIWMRRILEKLSQSQNSCTTIFCDNSSTIKLSKNPVLHGRSKHIDVQFHFLRDLSREGTVKLVYCCTQEQLANIMTKLLSLNYASFWTRLIQQFHSSFALLQDNCSLFDSFFYADIANP
uniref:Retrovirus-related Pol polyprotein from transposon TNT 1-94 n=1 Tax=Cajanus cajan TaxID=3821 RepID=A0A151T798_CAJCA|nr:Retrovirus-related Pol polyprotein from transposon TNT 1-94 [Cajanus cajan]